MQGPFRSLAEFLIFHISHGQERNPNNMKRSGLHLWDRVHYEVPISKGWQWQTALEGSALVLPGQAAHPILEAEVQHAPWHH